MSSQSGATPKALVVYDDYTTRTLIVEFLEDEGFDVRNFDFPDDVGNEIRGCTLVVMDVRFKKYGPDGVPTVQPQGGIEYVIQRITDGVLDPAQTTIVFVSRWGKDHPDVQQRLAQVKGSRWIDISTGLELVELKRILPQR